MLWLWNLLWRIPPGVCVALLGTEALVITLIIIVLPADKAKKPAWIVGSALIGILLTFGEIEIITHDRRETFDQHEKDMIEIVSKLANVDNDVLAMQRNFRAQSVVQHSSDPLRAKILDLSNEILQFLISREVPPGYGQGGFGEGAYGGKPSDTKDYDGQTVNMYMNVFEPRVSKIRQELKQRGLTDPELEREYGQTVNTFSIRAIAERLTVLAERLPHG